MPLSVRFLYGDMGERDLSVGRVGVAATLAGAAALFVVAVWLLASDVSGTLVLAVMAVPLLVVLAPLFYLAREVGSQADDPEEVEARLAEGLGLSKEEFDRRREGEGRYVHPAEREFED